MYNRTVTVCLELSACIVLCYSLTKYVYFTVFFEYNERNSVIVVFFVHVPFNISVTLVL